MIDSISISPVSYPYSVDVATTVLTTRIDTNTTSFAKVASAIMTWIGPKLVRARLRVYGEAPNESHIDNYNCQQNGQVLCNGCEAVALFQSVDLDEERQRIIAAMEETTLDDEACVCKGIGMRPVAFVHEGHSSIEVISEPAEAIELASMLIDMI